MSVLGNGSGVVAFQSTGRRFVIVVDNFLGVVRRGIVKKGLCDLQKHRSDAKVWYQAAHGFISNPSLTQPVTTVIPHFASISRPLLLLCTRISFSGGLYSIGWGNDIWYDADRKAGTHGLVYYRDHETNHVRAENKPKRSKER